MKKLIIIRHAHAEDYATSGQDFDRKLVQKGEEAAMNMAQELVNQAVQVQAIYSSPAARAKRTAELFAEVLAYPKSQIHFVEGIYEATLYSLVGILNKFDNQYDTIAVFGHNPGFTYLADYLGNQPIDGLPKAGMVLISFPQEDWGSITQGSGITHWLRSPKERLVFV